MQAALGEKGWAQLNPGHCCSGLKRALRPEEEREVTLWMGEKGRGLWERGQKGTAVPPHPPSAQPVLGAQPMSDL